jgi:hypothetical protein
MQGGWFVLTDGWQARATRELVAMELGAVITGDGTGAPGGSSDEFNGPAVGGLDGAGGELADDGEAGYLVSRRKHLRLPLLEFLRRELCALLDPELVAYGFPSQHRLLGTDAHQVA